LCKAELLKNRHGHYSVSRDGSILKLNDRFATPVEWVSSYHPRVRLSPASKSSQWQVLMIREIASVIGWEPVTRRRKCETHWDERQPEFRRPSYVLHTLPKSPAYWTVHQSCKKNAFSPIE
jgi:hypothetical protein